MESFNVGPDTTSSNSDDEPPLQLVLEPKRQRKIRIPCWLRYFAFMGSYGALLPSMVLFGSQSSLLLFMGKGIEE